MLKKFLALALILTVLVCGMSVVAFADEPAGDDAASSEGTTGDDTAAGDTSDSTDAVEDGTDAAEGEDTSSGESEADDGHDHDEEEEEKEKTGFAKFWDSYNQIIGYVVAGILFVAMVIFIIKWIPKESDKKKKAR